jgi:hypothetical protein
MTTPTPGIRRLFVGVGFRPSPSWTAPEQLTAQRWLSETLTAMWDRARVKRELCERLPTEDGELLLLPPGIDEPSVVASLLTGTSEQIAQANRRAEAQGSGIRLRIRMALSEGVSHEADFGHAGPPVVALRSMLASQVLRRALDSDPAATLAVAISDQVFQETVAQRYSGLDPQAFHPVSLEDSAKDLVIDAWIFVAPDPGRDRRRPTMTDDADAFTVIQGLPQFVSPPQDNLS